MKDWGWGGSEGAAGTTVWDAMTIGGIGVVDIGGGGGLFMEAGGGGTSMFEIGGGRFKDWFGIGEIEAMLFSDYICYV